MLAQSHRLWDTKLGAGERWGIQRTGNYRPDALLAALRIQKGKKVMKVRLYVLGGLEDKRYERGNYTKMTPRF